ncbi:MAG: bifunctional 5,10-methylenetetrahydrofolate dehydrogenase/5,10-methenyltetrahydrofolate cyclohydrolase [Candidatus Latescibacterota bacterium]|nr:MAG: bifunctional 5,10-methylenetetrahydrofolate dehydrogenase/5,10-methenyltetrahydrofolate cyclohydrolase [Candidatus Latescibacterota bacterium]
MNGADEKRIDGKTIARRIEEEAAETVRRLRESGTEPRLVSVAVDEEDASFASYLRSREQACLRVGIRSDVVVVPAADPTRSLGGALEKLSADRTVHAILLKLPLPPGADEAAIFARIDPAKDVEGLHPLNAGLLASGRPRFVPCTALAVAEILAVESPSLAGKDVVILGRSRVVGSPLAVLLLRKGTDATVTVCHSRTRDLAGHARRADVLVAAVGRPEMVTGEWIRPGAIVIDVGTHAIEDPSAKKGWRLAGDVRFESAEPACSRITPVPGGVGPVTTAVLLRAAASAAASAAGGDR